MPDQDKTKTDPNDDEAQLVIPFSVFRSQGLHEKEALALWQKNMAALYAVRPVETSGEPFRVCVSAWNIQDAVLTDFSLSPHHWDRSRARIGRDGLDMFMVELFIKGGCVGRNGGISARAGDVLIHDMAQPEDLLNESSETLGILLPRRLLAPQLRSPDANSLRVLPAGDPLCTLLRAHLMALRAYMPSLTLAQARAIMPATTQLAAAAINSMIKDEQTGAIRMAIVHHICKYIDEHIFDPNLEPEAIALRFSMTRRNLAYLFETYGGVASYIRRKRLALVYAALSDPRRRGQSIEEIARSHGFVQYRSFAMAFQKQFELSPREARALKLERGPVPMMPDDGLVDWVGWLKALY